LGGFFGNEMRDANGEFHVSPLRSIADSRLALISSTGWPRIPSRNKGQFNEDLVKKSSVPNEVGRGMRA
jgi:hypothetical protein